MRIERRGLKLTFFKKYKIFMAYLKYKLNIYNYELFLTYSTILS